MLDEDHAVRKEGATWLTSANIQECENALGAIEELADHLNAKSSFERLPHIWS